ncbi:4-(cytidine 5'-diphospho)-2-C-methyl-D-erythritol kinase [Alcanivorax sp. JB21]|uniref:4-(cytidine 5'-diphospho)-2-C-methyl-D-erythritol kinase n=1 Tax=Alcanivorax limicola TaxID=2874102 RepID=UPI001CBFAEDB|nr:4-(cytidine 5'-diphospho)-2-C-methyl-D-erythritol kinase [Alcanivorax limicola]MBZ2188592.1 4-(cytidine 5'-diphospho)-2-C-methyl-D-erythritol kinase [Alcanivorax limicola]
MTSAPLTLPAPAKLNLFLHITGRRPDGYHTLQTLFTLLDAGDVLEFSPADTLTLAAPDVPGPQQDNLVWRAASLLQQHTGCRQGAHIRLHKHLPAGGGVGGGSSDAATTLLGLNHLWALGCSLDELAQLGVQLGADVPVFVRGHSAFAEGIGEQLTAVALPPQDYLVVHPGVPVATAQIFNHRELTRNTPVSTVAAFLEPATRRAFHNDCEPVVRQLFSAVDQAMTWLEKEVGESHLTGTGACVFAPVTDRQSAATLLAGLPPRWTGFVARSCAVSPLHQALGVHLPAH